MCACILYKRSNKNIIKLNIPGYMQHIQITYPSIIQFVMNYKFMLTSFRSNYKSCTTKNEQ